jgi:agmatinase
MPTAHHKGNEFLALPEEFARRENARVLVLPIPYEATTTYGRGTVRGPRAILEASSQVEFFDEMRRDEPCRGGIHTLPPLDCRGTPEHVIDRIARDAENLAREGRFLLSLGGEHSLTVGAVEGIGRALGPLTVVQVDAHADLREEYEGSPFNHACVMRRIVERHPIVEVGIRALSVEESRFIEETETPVAFADEIRAARRSGAGPGVAGAGWMARAIESIKTDRVYLTFDLDGLDPSIMPAVGTPEPGGLLWDEALAFVQALFERREVVAADVVELCPIEGLAAPDFLAARLAYKIAGHAARA